MQGQVLQHNVSAGVIISETSLVLQRVSRMSTGRYTCHASNAEGEGSSSPYYLQVSRKSIITKSHTYTYVQCPSRELALCHKPAR